MATTQPIKNKEDLNALKEYYLTGHPNLRNYALISTGVNTALRIGDILRLTWKDVYDFQKDCFLPHITVTEHKTGKRNCIAMNESLQNALAKYKDSIHNAAPHDYLFPGRNPDAPLCRSQAFRIIKNASQELHLEDNISCHSLRKTFGYHAWHSGVNPAVLMVIYNHSSFQITKRYLGIDQDDKDHVFLNMNL